MLFSVDEKMHVIYRALFEGSQRRHFVGTVTAVDGAACRLSGYAYLSDPQTRMFERKPDLRETVVDTAHPGYITNIIHPDTDIESVQYRYVREVGLVCTDGKVFELNINEYGAKS